MNILQISAPKTGSYWLHNILREILRAKNIPVSSFIEGQDLTVDLTQETLSFRDQAKVDMVDIEEDGYFYRVSSLVKEPIGTLSTYAAMATLTWTHSTWCSTSADFFNAYDKKVIIVRDPRDRALSSAKFAFTPYMRRYYPTPYKNPKEFLDQEYERLLDQWVWFYGNYLLRAQKFNLHFVFYENLLSDFNKELENLLTYLELDLDAEKKDQLQQVTSFSSLKEKSPGHLQKGKSRKWLDQLRPEQKRLAVERTEPLLSCLGYVRTASETPARKKIGRYDSRAIEQLIQEKDWQQLFE